MSEYDETMDELVQAARALAARGLARARTGNVSLRTGDRVLVSGTGTDLGSLAPAGVSVIALDGTHLDGPVPSKEAFLHVAMLRARPGDAGVVHTHSTNAAAVSCLRDVDPDDAIPPLTAYFAMRVGRVRLLPYHAPGDVALGPIAEEAAAHGPALLLRNHGPIASAASISEAVELIDEIEETSRILLLLHGQATRPLDTSQFAALRPSPTPHKE